MGVNLGDALFTRTQQRVLAILFAVFALLAIRREAVIAKGGTAKKRPAKKRAAKKRAAKKKASAKKA